MSTEKIVIAGYEVNYINETGDIIDEVQLTEQIEAGDRSGNLYWSGYIIAIGRWWITDWKAIAEALYTALQIACEGDTDDPQNAVIIDKAATQYEEAVKG